MSAPSGDRVGSVGPLGERAARGALGPGQRERGHRGLRRRHGPGGLNLDVIVDFGSTTSGAIRAVKDRGRVVLVGLGKAEWTINSIDLVSRAIDLQGATVAGVPEHLQAVIDLVASGEVSVKAETIVFDEIPDGLARLQRGEVNGRLVALLD